MRRRLLFLVPNVECAKTIVNELLLARVDEHHIHVIAREGTPLEDLPQANLLQKSDFVHAAERGLAVGGATGTLAGVAAVTFPPAGIVMGGGAVLALALAGAGIGAWASSLVGISLPNTHLKQYQQAIEDGEILMMVDVPKERVDEVSRVIETHHPEVHMRGIDPQKPAFP